MAGLGGGMAADWLPGSATVCPSVCTIDFLNKISPKFMIDIHESRIGRPTLLTKFYGEVGLGPGRNRLDFGGDLSWILNV